MIRELTNKLFEKFPVHECREKWIEELLELALKLQQTKFKEITNSEIIEEIADVYIILDQMDKVYGNYAVYHAMQEKEISIMERIDEIGLVTKR